MRPLILASSLFLLLSSCSEQKEPNYLKLIENCADKLSQPAIAEELNIYYSGLNRIAKEDMPDFKKYYNDRIKLFSNLLKLPLNQKKTYLVYQPALRECELSWERNPIAFKSRWE